MKEKAFPFYLSIFALFIGIVAPNLFSDGMFVDGIDYATIARNLAYGIGSFWDLQLTETLYPHFHEHPPLAMGLQSIFFYIFGDSIYVERLYSLSNFLITAYLIVLIWRKALAPEYKKLAWLPLIFWLSIPLNIWAVSNNMLENTMMVFTTLSVLFMMHSIENKRIFFLFLAGLSLFLAFLTKGFTALFPLGFFLWALLFRKINVRRFFADTFLLLLFTILPFAMLFLFSEEAIASIEAYLDIQVLDSIKNTQTVDSRFFILVRLFKEMIPALLISIILVALLWKKNILSFSAKTHKYSSYLFLALGLSGVIPIMVSMKQSGFYMLAAFPFFAIFFASVFARTVNKWFSSVTMDSKGFKTFKILSAFLLLISIGISIMQIGKVGRDEKMLKDIYAVMEIVPEKSTISILPEMYENWSLHAYFYRYAYISLDPDNQHPYLLTTKNAEINSLAYKEMPVDLEKFRLYRRTN